ncbi:MAG: hypothetical protein LC753_07945 [Acidobacteria bacterium]|nr:hypothetical protein [Acidobacteriota bacterium]
MKPLGDSSTFFQHYVMRESHVDTAAAYLEIGEVKFHFGDHFVIRSFAGPITGALPVVYVGHGWTVAGRDIDPYAGVDVKGKVVLAHGPRALPKGVEIRQIGGINVGANTAFAEAARRGAAGIIFIPQTSALQNWTQMQGQNTVVRALEPPVPSAYAAPPVTSVLLVQKATDALLAGERVEGAEMVARGDRQDYPLSFQLKKTVTLHLPVGSTTDHRPYNVVGLMEGSDPS